MSTTTKYLIENEKKNPSFSVEKSHLGLAKAQS